MEIIKFEDLFNAFRGANSDKMPELTEKVVYSFSNLINKIKKIPVLSGSDSNKGIIGYVPLFIEPKNHKEIFVEKNKIRYFLNKKDCITMIRCGNAGKMTYRSKEEFPVFSLTTSIFAFFLKDIKEIRKKHPSFEGLNLKWFSYKYNYLMNNLVNQEGLSTVPLRLINPLDLEIPKLKIQEEELELYEKIYEKKNKVEYTKNKLDKIKGKYLEIEIDGEDIPLKKILTHISRNDSLSQEGIYKRSDEIKYANKKINVLSGSFDEIYGVAPLDERLHYVEKKQAIHVITRGKAGNLRQLKKGNYATNTNAMLLILKDEIKRELNITDDKTEEEYLRFLRYYLEPLFLKYISSSDLGVLPLTEVLEKITIPKVELNKKIKEISSDYKKFEDFEEKVNVKIDKINSLLSKQVLFN